MSNQYHNDAIYAARKDPAAKLTPKQKDFADRIVAGDTPTEAVQAVYPSLRGNMTVAKQNLRSDAVRAYIQKKLIAKNIHDVIPTKLIELLDAKKRGPLGWENDNAAQLRALQQIYDLMDIGGAKQREGDKHLHLHFNAADEPEEVLEFVITNRRLPTDDERSRILGNEGGAGTLPSGPGEMDLASDD